MERIIIIGCGGSGKSTMARMLGERTGLPVVHLDRLFWREGWQQLSREEFDALLAEELAKPRWIMDGNFDRTMSLRLAACDTAIYLDFSRFTCLRGVIRRVITNFGRTRPDMGEGCPERFDLDFLKWVWNYNKTKRPQVLARLEKAEGVNVVILKNRRQVNRFLEENT